MPIDYSGQRATVEELQALITAQVHRRRAAISDGADPDRVNREIERLEKRIANDTAQVIAMKDRLANWRTIAEDCDTRIAELKVQLTQTQNRSEIDKLKDLAATLMAELGVDTVEEALALIKGK